MKCVQPRHKWTWQSNTNATMKMGFGTAIRISYKGAYKCEHCGQKKLGPPRSQS